jgi:capsular exopolysaccharide synthesis family protein
MKAVADLISATPMLASAAPSAVSHDAMADSLVSLLAPESAAADRYRALRYSIEALRTEAGLPVIALTSPNSGDGKTVTVLNLAGAFAQAEGARVLVVDADLRKPSVARYLGLDSRLPGLSRAVRSAEVRLDAIAHRVEPFNLWIVPGGVPDPSPCERLNSPALAALIRQARRDFDCVLIDTPPALLPDCRLIERWVDGFLMLVTAHKTPRRLLTEALKELDPAKVLGIVFNGDERAATRYYGYYQTSDHRRGRL